MTVSSTTSFNNNHLVLPNFVLLKFTPRSGTHKFTEYSWDAQETTLITRQGTKSSLKGHTYRKQFKNVIALQKDLLKRIGAKLAEGYYYVKESNNNNSSKKTKKHTPKKCAWKTEQYASKINSIIYQQQKKSTPRRSSKRKSPAAQQSTPSSSYPRVTPEYLRWQQEQRELDEQLRIESTLVTPPSLRKRRRVSIVPSSVIDTSSVRRRLSFSSTASDNEEQHLVPEPSVLTQPSQHSLLDNSNHNSSFNMAANVDQSSEEDDHDFGGGMGGNFDFDDSNNDVMNTTIDDAVPSNNKIYEPSQPLSLSTPPHGSNVRVRELELENTTLRENLQELERAKQLLIAQQQEQAANLQEKLAQLEEQGAELFRKEQEHKEHVAQFQQVQFTEQEQHRLAVENLLNERSAIEQMRTELLAQQESHRLAVSQYQENVLFYATLKKQYEQEQLELKQEFEALERSKQQHQEQIVNYERQQDEEATKLRLAWEQFRQEQEQFKHSVAEFEASKANFKLELDAKREDLLQQLLQDEKNKLDIVLKASGERNKRDAQKQKTKLQQVVSRMNSLQQHKQDVAAKLQLLVNELLNNNNDLYNEDSLLQQTMTNTPTPTTVSCAPQQKSTTGVLTPTTTMKTKAFNDSVFDVMDQ